MAAKKKVAKKKVAKKRVAKKPVGPRKFTARDVENLTELLNLPDEELMARIPNPEARERINSFLSEEEKEARLVMVHRLQMRGLSTKEIAAQLGCSTPLVYRLKAQLKERQLDEMRDLSWPSYISKTMADFSAIKQQAMMASSAKGSSATARNQALQVWLQADRSEKEFLQRLGLLGSAEAATEAMRIMMPSAGVDSDIVGLEAVGLITQRIREVGVRPQMIEGQVIDTEVTQKVFDDDKETEDA